VGHRSIGTLAALMGVNMIRAISAAVVFAVSCAAFAHDSEPEADETPALAAMRYCQTIGVRAAWGAQARFLGAPAVFKYIPETPLKKMFMGDTEIPADAIYVLDALDLGQRRQYEEVAFEGWKAADRWVKDGKERPEFEVLAAVFYHDCKQSLTLGAKD
jgi:hypothetical protein